MGAETLVVLGIFCLVLALAFDFVNGFHDTANACATVIHSGAMKPWKAITMSGILNFAGAATVGTSVAMFITKIIPPGAATVTMITAVLLSGLFWNVLTWWKKLPVSSSHCLIGSLIGAGIAAGGLNGVNFHEFFKALASLIVSPIIGFAIAFSLAWLLYRVVARIGKSAEKTLPYVQILSSAAVSYSHGSNDGQKTMGIMAMVLAKMALVSGTFAAYHDATKHIPFEVVLAAAAAIGVGTMIGGGRIIETVKKMSLKPIDPVHGCAAELTTAATVFGASYVGVPVSTTHVLNSAVVGGAYGLHGSGSTDPKLISTIIKAWLLTLPVTAAIAYVTYLALNLFIN